MPELSPSQVRQFSLAGTVSCPPQFPDVGTVRLVVGAIPDGCQKPSRSRDVVEVTHEISPRVEIRRCFPLDSVNALFVPENPSHVDLKRGTWYVGEEVHTALESAAGELTGIVYTPESAATLMRVEVAMTAAESAQYYPPLAGDRSHNHYQFTTSGESCG